MTGVSISGDDVTRPGNEHGDGNQDRHRHEQDAEQNEEGSDRLRERSHEPPKRWLEIETEASHRPSESFPSFDASHQLVPAMVIDEACSHSDAGNEKSKIQVFINCFHGEGIG